MRKILNYILFSPYLCQLIDNLHKRVHLMMAFLLPIWLLHQDVEIFLDCVHNGLDE